MAKLSKGTTFTTGVQATAADLNNLVDSATILPGIITEQGSATPATGDSLLLYDTSASGLAKCTLQNVIDLIPSDPAAGTKGLRTLGTGATQAAAGNDTRFSSSVTGIRRGNGAGSADVAATPNTLMFSGVNISGLTNIDFNAGDLFYEGGLPVNRTYTFTNAISGAAKVLVINNNGHTITWPVGVLQLGTQNTASWNVYSVTITAVASIVVCSN